MLRNTISFVDRRYVVTRYYYSVSAGELAVSFTLRDDLFPVDSILGPFVMKELRYHRREQDHIASYDEIPNMI